MATAFALIDGYDIYPDINTTSEGLQGYYTLNSPIDLYVVTGRFGGQAIKATGYVTGFYGTFYRQFSGLSALTVGHASLMGSFLLGQINYNVVGLWNGGPSGTLEVGVCMTSNQKYAIYVGSPSNVVATDANLITVGSWHYVELEVVPGPTGSATLFVDGFQVATYSGNLGAATTIDTVGFGPIGNQPSTAYTTTHSYDDVYVSNSATREGERRVETLVPSSDSQKQWTPLSGTTNYTEVNQLPIDGDTTYVYSSTVGNEDRYGITSLSGNPQAISAVQVRVCARKDDSATRTMSSIINSAGTEVDGATFALAASYLYQSDIYPLNPNGSAAWTASTVNAVLIGQRVVS